jgi:hypothetical protein
MITLILRKIRVALAGQRGLLAEFRRERVEPPTASRVVRIV